MQAWQDVVAEFPPEIAASILPPESNKKKGAGRANDAAMPSDLSEAERAALKLLTTDEPVHVDSLSEATGLGVSELSAVMLSLEMRDLVRQLPGRCFVRKL